MRVGPHDPGRRSWYMRPAPIVLLADVLLPPGEAAAQVSKDDLMGTCRLHRSSYFWRLHAPSR